MIDSGVMLFFFFQAEDGIRDADVTGVQTCALPIFCCVLQYRHATNRRWAFTKSIMALENIDKQGTEWLGEVLKIAPWRFSDHWVAVPFLIYWLLAGLTHFNSTVFIVITLATFTAQLAIYRRYIVPSTAAVLPIALVLFSPAHYMELLWGFQFR